MFFCSVDQRYLFVCLVHWLKTLANLRLKRVLNATINQSFCMITLHKTDKIYPEIMHYALSFIQILKMIALQTAKRQGQW